MKYPNLISLYSPVMQSGKSTIANHLIKDHGFTRVSFADPIKAMVRALLLGMGFDRATVDRMVDGDLKEVPVPGLVKSSPRHMLQTIGTEWGREAIQNDLWITVALSKVNSIIADGGRAVIDDMRFPNEYAAVMRRSDAIVAQVVRPTAKAYADHPSEGLLAKEFFDLNIRNAGSLKDLRLLFDRMLYTIAPVE